MEKYNTHHILFTRKEYNKTYEPYLLRSHPAMQVEIPVVDHNELHANVPAIPVMSTNLARYALQTLDAMPDNLYRFQRFDRLNERFYQLSRKMGHVAIEAGAFNEFFDAQIDFFERIKNGRV